MSKPESTHKKLSLTYRFLRKLEPNLSEEKYWNISPLRAIWPIIKYLIASFVMTLKRLAYAYCYFGVLFNNANKMWLRAWLWRRIGAHVGKNVHIYHRVALDYSNAKYLFIEDDVSITNGCTLLCHRRDLENYRVGDCMLDMPYVQAEIHLKKGCFIGMNTMILPGVTVGEGAFVCACSVISKDIPPWTVAAGSPARVVRKISPREDPIEKQQGGGQHHNVKVFSSVCEASFVYEWRMAS